MGLLFEAKSCLDSQRLNQDDREIRAPSTPPPSPLDALNKRIGAAHTASTARTVASMPVRRAAVKRDVQTPRPSASPPGSGTPRTSGRTEDAMKQLADCPLSRERLCHQLGVKFQTATMPTTLLGAFDTFTPTGVWPRM